MQFGTVQGFDPNDYAVEKSKEAGDVEIEKGGLPDGIPFEGAFDLVGAFDVIEHVDDDSGSLKALYGRTKEGGYALFTVPAFQFL